MNDLLSVRETAQLLRLHEVSVRRLVSQKKISAIKIGGKVFIKRKELGLSEEKVQQKEQSLYGDLLKQGNENIIGVWGVGYIGFSTLVNFAVADVKGIGFDVDPRRVDRVNKGEVDIPGLEEWLNAPVKYYIAHQLIRATNDPQKLFSERPLVHFICVPTEREGEPWLDPLVDVTAKIALHIASQKSPFIPLVIVESTLTPGSCDQIILKIFEKHHVRIGKDVLFAIAPRRDWFVDKEKTLRKLDRVYGASDDESARQTRSVLSIACDTLHQASSYHTAELVKSVENAYRHMDITLANQLSIAYPDVSMREVLRLVGTKWNVGTYYPSFGTGGYCIPLSSKYVLSGADHPEALTLLQETVETDSNMPRRVAKALIERKVKSVGILGLSYRGNIKVPNLSPTISIARELKRHMVKVRIHDPFFDEQEIKRMTGCGMFSFPDEVDHFEALVVVANHAEYQTPSIRRMLDNNKKCRVIYDNVGIWQNLTYFKKRGIEYYMPGDAHWLE